MLCKIIIRMKISSSITDLKKSSSSAIFHSRHISAQIYSHNKVMASEQIAYSLYLLTVAEDDDELMTTIL